MNKLDTPGRPSIDRESLDNSTTVCQRVGNADDSLKNVDEVESFVLESFRLKQQMPQDKLTNRLDSPEDDRLSVFMNSHSCSKKT